LLRQSGSSKEQSAKEAIPTERKVVTPYCLPQRLRYWRDNNEIQVQSIDAKGIVQEITVNLKDAIGHIDDGLGT